MMEIGPNLAYIGSMSWRDYIDPEDRAALQEQMERREAETDAYNALYKKLKTKGEQRRRRGKKPMSETGPKEEN